MGPLVVLSEIFTTLKPLRSTMALLPLVVVAVRFAPIWKTAPEAGVGTAILFLLVVKASIDVHTYCTGWPGVWSSR